MRRLLVAGNWKMHGTRQSVDSLLQGLNQQDWPDNVDLMVAPPSLYIQHCLERLSGSQLYVGAHTRLSRVR